MGMADEMMREYPPSLAGAAKMKEGVPSGFAFFAFEWLGDRPDDWDVMKLTGAVLREAKSGPRKGERVIPVKGTERTVFVTSEEIKRAQCPPQPADVTASSAAS